MTCLLLGVSLAWFYKWRDRALGAAAASGLFTTMDRRRDTIDRAVRVMFTKQRGLHGSPRLHADLRDDGWEISEKTVADSMRRQGLVARRIKRRNGLTKQDKTAPKFPDLLKRDFTADRQNARWGRHDGDPRRSGRQGAEAVSGDRDRPLLASPARCCKGAASRRRTGVCGDQDGRRGPAVVSMPSTGPAGAPTSRSGSSSTPTQASTYTANSFTRLCRRLGIRQSMGRVGSRFDNAAAEAVFSSREWEVLSRHQFVDPRQAQAVGRRRDASRGRRPVKRKPRCFGHGSSPSSDALRAA